MGNVGLQARPAHWRTSFGTVLGERADARENGPSAGNLLRTAEAATPTILMITATWALKTRVVKPPGHATQMHFCNSGSVACDLNQRKCVPGNQVHNQHVADSFCVELVF